MVEECPVINQNSLEFSISNSIDPNKPISKDKGGVGLENVQERLRLLYPEKHQLSLNHKPDLYTVSLTLNLESI